MTIRIRPKATWGDLLKLPEAPEDAPRPPSRRRRPSLPNSLDDVSKHFATLQALKSISGPLTLRQALIFGKGQTVSQEGIARLLAPYLGGKTFTRSTVSLWERAERGQRLPAKYRMTSATRDAYRRLLADVVALASDGRFQLKARLGPRVWAFAVVATCRSCQKPYTVARSKQVNCPRCIRKERRS